MGLKADLLFVYIVGQTNLCDFCAHKVATSSKSLWTKTNQTTLAEIVKSSPNFLSSKIEP